MTTFNYYNFHLLGKPAGELEWKTSSGLKYQQVRWEIADLICNLQPNF